VQKQKIAFVVSSELFVRNYFRTDALSRLEQENDVIFIVSSKIKDRDPIEKTGRRVDYYQVDQEHQKRQFKTYKVLMWRYRDRSSTFRFRLERIFEPKSQFEAPFLKNLPRNLRAAVERVGIFYRRMRLSLQATSPFFDLIKRSRIDRLEPSRDIARLLTDAAPDLIVMPSSAFDPDGNDVIQHAKRLGVPTLFLIDNWDNLSSKSVMLLKPDHLGVWGEQTAGHARDIQDFDRADVSIIGTPRFDQYFVLRDTSLPSPFDFPYILFLGTSLSFDEASALQNLEAVLDRHPDRFSETQIVYRPHPWRDWSNSKDSIVGRGLSRVVLDPQVASQYLGSGNGGTQFQPDLSYYPGLLKNAEVVVGGLTSMLIEATIFGKDYIAMTYDDGINITNQRTVFERSEHFRGIETIPSIGLCKERSDVERLLIAAWDRRETLTRSEIDAARNFILFSDARPYSERLAHLIRDVLE